MSGIGVVLNPKSRQNRRDPGAALRLARQLGPIGVVREADSIDALYRIAEDFRRDAVDVLAISGGDGTNTVTLTGFMDVYGSNPLPQVALLRGGTMNTVARSNRDPSRRSRAPARAPDRCLRAPVDRAAANRRAPPDAHLGDG